MWKSACESAHTCPLINRKSHRKAMTKIPSQQNQVAYLMFQVQSEVNPLAQTPLNSLFTASWMCVPWILSSQCWTHTHTHTDSSAREVVALLGRQRSFSCASQSELIWDQQQLFMFRLLHEHHLLSGRFKTQFVWSKSE